MIEVKDISKSFKENMVLDSITMTASDGEITSIIGSNGAGKSTLIAIIMGYYFSDRGTFQSGNVSVMPDANAMFEDVTGLEFLNFISDLKNVPREEAVKYAEILGIKDDLQKKIQGYSFGMRKKISFIQAAIGNFQNYIFYHLSSPSRYLTKNILSSIVKIRKLFYFGLHFSVKSAYKTNTLC
ncbi:ATP-binding cassette domain-containing protein [Streptococcus suis]